MSSPYPNVIITSVNYINPEQLRNVLSNKTKILWIPEEEVYACNTIGFSDRTVLIPKGYPMTKRKLLQNKFKPITVEMDAIKKADGSLTCCCVFY